MAGSFVGKEFFYRFSTKQENVLLSLAVVIGLIIIVKLMYV